MIKATFNVCTVVNVEKCDQLAVAYNGFRITLQAMEQRATVPNHSLCSGGYIRKE